MLGQRLRKLREELGLTQDELAEKIGVAVLQINRYEQHNSQPKAELVARMAQALDVSADYLLGLTDDPAPAGLSKGELSAKERAAIAAWRRGEPYEAVKVIVGDE